MWTFFHSTCQFSCPFSCPFWFDNYSWTHCRHYRFFSLVSPILYTLQKCQCSTNAMRFIAVRVQWFHLSYALLSLLGQDATGIAYNTQHLSELAVSQLEVHPVHCIQYHRSCKVFWHFDLVVAMVDDAGMSDIFTIFRWVHAWF